MLWGKNSGCARAVLLVALAAALAPPAAYSAQTAATAHSGALPTAGPSGSTTGPGGGGRRAFGAGGAPRFAFGGGNGGPPAGFAPGGAAPGGFAGGGGFRGGGGSAGRAGGLGGLLDASTPNKALVTLLQADASSYRWVAAIVGANSAAGVQLATGDPVMAIGGFNGTDPSPTLAEFEADVAAGKIHYFVTSGGGGFGGGPGGAGGSDSSRAIASWVESTFTATTVGGVTVYDLSG
jgi:hypothetical protein